MSHHLSVSSKNLDALLNGIKAQISQATLDEVSLPGLEIEVALRARRRNGEEFRSLDLVSHSWGTNHLLLLGDGIPDEETFLVEKSPSRWMRTLLAERVRREIEKLQITEIRLLGCLTAFAPEGQAAMQELRKKLGLAEVFGTKDYLTGADFDLGGFKPSSADKLVSCAQIARDGKGAPSPLPEPRATPAVLGLDLDKVPALTVDELYRLGASPGFVPRSRLVALETEELYDAAGRARLSAGMSLFGLLSVPSQEYWIEAPYQPGRYRLVQILFDWHMLRVFSPELVPPGTPLARSDDLLTNSAVYSVEDPERLKRFLSEHRRQDPLPSLS